MHASSFSRVFLAVVAAAGVTSFAACSGNSASTANQLLPSSSARDGRSKLSVASSGPLTWQAVAGGSRNASALQALAMLPNSITIDEGDSITWTDAGEGHTVTFLGSYSAPPADPLSPQGGSTFDGSGFESSGLLFPGQTYALKFTKAGVYPYACFLHVPEMSGVVIVQPSGSALPNNQDFYTGSGTSTMNSLLDQALSSVKTMSLPAGGTTIAAGVSPAAVNNVPSTSTVLSFLSGDRLNSTSVTVKAGTTVTWVNLSNNEPHTVTFPVAGQPLPPLPGDPFTPPIGGSTYDGSAVTNSGMMYPGQQYSLTFTKPGTYSYLCLFHDQLGMLGTVIVQ